MSGNPSLWQRMYARVVTAAARDPHVKVGVLASRGGAETPERGGPSLATLLAIHEYGAPAAGIPERAPLRRTFSNTRAELGQFAGRLSRAYLLGKIGLEQALGLLGEWGAAAVKRTIIEGLPPPNAPATIARKKSSTPLIDTSQLLNSVSYEVVSGGSES